MIIKKGLLQVPKYIARKNLANNLKFKELLLWHWMNYKLITQILKDATATVTVAAIIIYATW